MHKLSSSKNTRICHFCQFLIKIFKNVRFFEILKLEQRTCDCFELVLALQNGS